MVLQKCALFFTVLLLKISAAAQSPEVLLDSLTSTYAACHSLEGDFAYYGIRKADTTLKATGNWYYFRDGRVHFNMRDVSGELIGTFLQKQNDTLGEYYGRQNPTGEVEYVGAQDILNDVGGISGAALGMQSELFFNHKIRERPNYILGALRDTSINNESYLILPVHSLHIYSETERKENEARINKIRSSHPGLPIPPYVAPKQYANLDEYIIHANDLLIHAIVSTTTIDKKPPIKNILEYHVDVNMSNAAERWKSILANFKNY